MGAKPMQSLKITKGIFDAAKILLNGGATNAEVEKYLKVSKDVVTLFRRAETYEEYQAMMFEKSQRQKQQKRVAAMKANEEPKPETKTADVPAAEVNRVVTVQLSHYVMTEIQKQNELLTGISNKLAFIIDELCGVKTGGNADAEPDN